MIRTFRNWMRLVIPRWELVFVLGILYACFELIYLVVILSRWENDNSGFADFRVGSLATVACLYGIFRVCGFHPTLNRNYRRWLEVTPWTWKLPLPGGPIHLVAQDVVCLLILFGLNRNLSPTAFYIPLCFLISYLGILSLVNWAMGAWMVSYGVGFGMGALFLHLDRPDFQLLMLLGCYPLALLGLQFTLRRFPENASAMLEFEPDARMRARPEQRLGWPYDALSPKPSKEPMTRHDAICFALLAGWWQLAVLWGVDPTTEARVPVLALPAIACLGLSIARVIPFFYRHRSPIDLWGRIATGRWIIPKFDALWIPTLAALLFAMPLQIWAIAYESCVHYSLLQTKPPTDWRYGLSISLGPVGTTASFLSWFLLGPKLEDWRLTGQHRIVFLRLDSDYIEV